MEFFEGKANTTIPRYILDAAKNRPDEKFELHHVVVPRDLYDTQTRDFPKHAQFASCYVGPEGEILQEMPEFEFDAGEGLAIANLLKDAKLVNSTSDALRMIRQGAVKNDGDKVEDTKLVVGAGCAVYQVGKRKFARITLN